MRLSCYQFLLLSNFLRLKSANIKTVSSKFSFITSDLLLNFVFKLYHKTCEQFYRNFGIYEKSPNSFLPGLSRSIINQFRFHNFLCLCLASVHLPYPFHLVFSFQLFGHVVLLCQLWHDQLHAVSCRFVNLSAILSYVHPAICDGTFLCTFNDNDTKKATQGTADRYSMYACKRLPHRRVDWYA